MSEVIIEAIDLARSFNGRDAVSGLSLRVRAGELFGIVGPDGAGKTTLLRLLAAILTPTSGDAHIGGYSVRADAELVKSLIGYMPQRFGLYEDLTVLENIQFFADLFGVAGRARQERIDRLLGFSNLTPFTKRLAGQLSGGMKQKLGLACSLVHTPRVLLLDEPTNGVDPVSRRDFWKILYELIRDGVTIVLTTSYLDEAERCARVGMMHQGGMIVVDRPEHLKAMPNRRMFELRIDGDRKAVDLIGTSDGVLRVTRYGDRHHIAMKADSSEGDLRDALHRAGVVIKACREIVPSLEDVFISLTEDRCPKSSG